MSTFFFRRAAGLGFLSVFFAWSSARAATLHTLYPASTPLSGIVRTADGNFYGTSRYGGDNDLGSVFRLTTAGVPQVIYSFAGLFDGSHPCAALTIGPDGQLYGTCQYGGFRNGGSVFKITTSGVFTLLHPIITSTEGTEPIGGLITGDNGMLFGTASRGGTLGFGTVFQVSTNGAFTTLHDFSGSDGDSPAATLTPGPSGPLFGTTQYGGANDRGTVFRITLAGTFTSLFSFNGANGAVPSAPLARGADNAFYGTTAYGGSSEFGSIFKITFGGTFTFLYSMVQENLGSNPLGGVVFGPDGNLYGTANYGGANGFGLLFQLAAAGGFSSLYDLTGDADGGNPFTTLAPGRYGNFYGTTSLGGTGGGGTLYELTTGPYFDLIRLLPNGQQVLYGGIGGTPNGQYVILTTTDVVTPLANWAFSGLRLFDAAGRFSFTNAVNRQEPRRFYLLRQL